MNEPAKPPNVLVFSTPTCSFCNMVKKYFGEKGVRFTEIDVSRDYDGAREMLRRSGQMGVPVIDIGGRIVIGFNKPQID